MVNSLKNKLAIFLNKGHDRTSMAKKNVLMSFGVKGISIIIGLVIVPLTIHYLNSERYGIWLSVSSIILWFNFFDFGLGNGLRNRLSAAMAIDDINEARQLISTAYASLIVISISLCAVFLSVNPFIKWDRFLGLSIAYRNDLKQLIGILLVFFCLQFVLQIINTINYALQRSAVVSLNFLLGSVFSLVFVITLTYTTSGNLLYLGVAYFSGNVLALLMSSIYFFFFVRPDLRPTFRDVSFYASKSILSLGGKFFVIQIAGIVQYQSVNVLISRYFNPTNVTEYSIAYKMFNVVMMVFSIIMTPIWSAVTEANSKGDFYWIKSTEKKLLKIWIVFVLLGLGLLILSPVIYKFWIKDAVNIPFSTSLGVMLYIQAMTFGMIYVHILNGLGRLKTQFYISIITMIVFIPMTYFLSVYLKMGIIGISLSLIVANVNGLVAAPVEYRLWLKRKLNRA